MTPDPRDACEHLDHLGPADAPDRFALLRPLGRGSMGVVYEARDQLTGHRVALKTLARDEAQFLTDLKREFRLVQSVIHPNLVRLEGLFQGNGTWFLTMELIEGRDVLTWIRRGDEDEGDHGDHGDPGDHAPGTPASAAAIDRLQRALPQLGLALQALHAEELIHRDVKPRNVLVTRAGRIVLLDFGLARAADDDPQGWSLAGTPAYMAPEQCERGEVTAAADCYAVGVLLYQALTGRLPFVGALEDLILQKRTWRPVAPSLLTPGIPVELEQLCLRLLDPEASARPTAGELAAWPRRPAPRAASVPAAPSSALFVGRDRELVRIEAAFAAGGFRPAVVVVEGESGIGKTALLREATRRFAGTRTLVLRGRCFEREVTAYAGVDMIMDALIEHLRRLDERAAYFAPRHLAALRQIFPALAAIPTFADNEVRPLAGRSHEMRLRAAAAFSELFARVATRYRMVLAIDDAQWLTEESLVLLRSLLAAAEPVPLVLLLAARGPDLGSLGPWLETLGGDVSRFALGPLSSEESLQLLRLHVGDRDEADLRTMAHDSAGHPYLLRELALATGAREPASRPQVDEVLRERAARLSPIERAVLDLVCAATAPISQRVVCAAAGLGLGEVTAVTSALVRHRYAVVAPDERDGSIYPAHDRVRAALRALLDEPARRELARRLALALEAHARDDVESLALQWSLAGDLPRAASFAKRAGDRAMEKLAFERAAELYDLASRSGGHGADHAALLTAMADALAAAGRGREAAAAYLRAAEGRDVLDGRVPDDLVMRAADQLIRSGQVAEGKQLLTGVLERHGLRLPASMSAAVRTVVLRRLALRLRGLRVRALPDDRRREVLRRIDACWLGGDLLAVLDPLRALALHTQGLLLALDAGEPYRLARSLCTEAALVVQPGRSKRDTALARLAFAEQLSKQVGAPQLEGYVALGNGIVRLLTGELDEAQRHLDGAEATFERCPGAYWEVGFARDFALWTLAYRGRLPELTQRVDAAVELCAARGDQLGAFKLLVGPSRLVLLARDEPHQLLEACRMELLGLSPKEYSFLAFCALFGRVNAFLYLGRADKALLALDEARSEIRASHVLYCQLHRMELAYLQGRAALARAGECDAAQHAPLIARVKASLRVLRRERVPWADAMATTLEASLMLVPSARAGTRALAIAGLRASATQLEGCGLRAFASAVKWQLEHVLGQRDGGGAEWHASTVARPDRFAQALAPLPIR